MSEQRVRPTPAPRELPPNVPGKTRRYEAGQKNFSITHVSPSSVVYNKHESVVVVFNKSLPSNVEFTVKFFGLRTQQIFEVPADKIGENVLNFRAPEYYPPEETELSVHHGNHSTRLCSYKPFTFISYLEDIKMTLMNVSDPVEFMCAALHLKQKNVVALDFELERQFKKNLPPNFDLLARNKRERTEEVQGAMQNPTLLHFAARYNLVKLAVAILECPGGYQALNVKNSEDLTPSDIANECGFERLGYVLAEAQQHPNFLIEPEEIYESMHDPSAYQAYISILNSSTSDDIYVPMNQADEEIYEAMAHYEHEEIYANADAMQASDDASSGYVAAAFREPRRSMPPKSESPYLRPRDAPDSKSIHSMTSTSSGESCASSGSGHESFRPAIATPGMQKMHKSYDETQFREYTSSFDRKKHLSAGANPTRTQPDNRYASLPRKASHPAVFSDYTYREDLPPPPPPARSPNVNYQG